MATPVVHPIISRPVHPARPTNQFNVVKDAAYYTARATALTAQIATTTAQLQAKAAAATQAAQLLSQATLSQADVQTLIKLRDTVG